MNSKFSLCAIVSCLSIAACAGNPLEQPSPSAAPGATLKSGVYLQNFDHAVRPQDDFYRYVNGLWLTTTQIPADRSNYGTFSLLQEAAEKDLRQILEEAARSGAAPGTPSQQVGDFYASFLDEATIQARGLQPLAEELKRIDALTTVRELAAYIGHAQRLAVAQPFAYYVAIDEKNSSQYVSVVVQSGLSMPDRDYYLAEDARLKAVRAKYQDYVRDLLAAAQTPHPAQAAQKIFAIESQLARAHWTRVQNRDAQRTYNRYERAALRQLMPSFDWDAFLAGAGAPAQQVSAVIVTQPSYFQALDRLLASVAIEDWRVYFRYKLLNTYAPDLPQEFVRLHFEFNSRTVSGVQELQPRWKRGVDTVENAIGELVGRMYVERHFKPQAKQRIDTLVQNLKAACAQGIDELQWMTPATRQKAHAKLALLTTKIGYPQRWRDWSGLQVHRDDLLGNQLRAAAVDFERRLAKLGAPIDRTEWLMTPQTVNAYYNPPANEIVFPAAILQPPFFNVEADDAVNYGAIGAVIGHEISHGFDDQGRRYDGHGNLVDWWAPADNEEFTRRAQALGAQYQALSPLPGTHVNGELTMGENIADLAGLTMAYRAYKLSLGGRPAPLLDGLTGEQRFFIGWAQAWARKYREDELRRRLLTDPHSPSEYRTNAVLANLAQFHSAFAVKPGDKMYRAPEQRVRIW